MDVMQDTTPVTARPIVLTIFAEERIGILTRFARRLPFGEVGAEGVRIELEVGSQHLRQADPWQFRHWWLVGKEKPAGSGPVRSVAESGDPLALQSFADRLGHALERGLLVNAINEQGHRRRQAPLRNASMGGASARLLASMGRLVVFGHHKGRLAKHCAPESPVLHAVHASRTPGRGSVRRLRHKKRRSPWREAGLRRSETQT